jgi:hypothetical protein
VQLWEATRATAREQWPGFGERSRLRKTATEPTEFGSPKPPYSDISYNIYFFFPLYIEGQGGHLPLYYSSLATKLLAYPSVARIGDALDVCADLVFARESQFGP